MKAFFESEWRSTEKVRAIRNPFDESIIDTVPSLEVEHLSRALDGLQQGSQAMLDLGREDHHAIFVRLRDRMEANSGALIRLIQTEQGKPLREATNEFNAAAHSISVLAENASLIGPEIRPLAAEPSSRGGLGFTLRQPHGIVGILTPLVFPLLFPVLQVCYALAAGNAVLLKPARSTPLVALKLVELLLESGLPPEAISCLPGSGPTLGAALCEDRRLNCISCIGRIPTIKAVRHVSSFVPTYLQWGCVSSVTVDRGTDLNRLMRSFLPAFDNAGQSAFTASWIGVVDELHDELIERLAVAMAQIKLGDPLHPSTQMGPVTSAISTKRFDRVLESEIASGADIVHGGKRNGRLIQPTLLRNCKLGETILAKQEMRGPIVGVTRIRNPHQVIETLKHQRYHILSLFTEKEGEVVRDAMHLPFENIHVNGIPTWRDGLICVPSHPPRSGLRDSYDRVGDFCRSRDVVCH